MDFIRENAQNMSDDVMAAELGMTESYVRWQRHRMGIWTKFDLPTREESMLPEYKHREAYCHMQYVCEQCQCITMIWNSRDGVTPYTDKCPACGGEMTHTNWGEDRPDPNYIPKDGDFIYISIPLEVAEILTRKRVAGWVQRGAEAPRFGTDEYNELVKDIMNEVYQDGQGPWLIRWLSE